MTIRPTVNAERRFGEEMSKARDFQGADGNDAAIKGTSVEFLAAHYAIDSLPPPHGVAEANPDEIASEAGPQRRARRADPALPTRAQEAL